jgi:hypothetical protein
MDALLRQFYAGLITVEELARQCVMLGYNGGAADTFKDPTGWNAR